MSNNPFADLSIRTGLAWSNNAGYILACNPDIEEKIPHVKIFQWRSGKLLETWAQFNAHSVCRISLPETGIVFLSSEGFYGIHSSTSHTGNIFDKSHPDPEEDRYGSFRSVSAIAGKSYAVGLRGMVYRLDDLDVWTRIDDGLSSEFDVQAIDGFNQNDIYAVGSSGELSHYNGKRWTKYDLPTNMNLTSVKCAGDGVVYLVGHDGVMIRGRRDSWSVIHHEETMDDLWDVEWFDNKLYVSTMTNVYRLQGDNLRQLDFKDNPPKSCYHLSTADGVIWSIGEYDVLSFDGKRWIRII